jgi:hypothetical protein
VNSDIQSATSYENKRINTSSKLKILAEDKKKAAYPHRASCVCVRTRDEGII